MKFKDIQKPKYEIGDKVEVLVGYFIPVKKIGRISAVSICYNDIDEQFVSYTVFWKIPHINEEEDAEVDERKVIRLVEEI